MKILTFTTLFPSQNRPNHGIFVETRLRELVSSAPVQARVIAPVPWFPSTNPKFGKYASFAAVPPAEVRSGIPVDHPRYLLLPKIGMSTAPALLAASAKAMIARQIDEGFDFDLIDAHYFYPDGVAATMVAKYFNKPVVITARGSDINVLPKFRLPRKMIRWAGENASAVISVSESLKNEMRQIGLPGERITTLRNGVDLERFHPIDRAAVRKSLGLEKFTLLSVGNLVPLKGHDLVIQSLTTLKDVQLLIAGQGPERQRLESLVHELNLNDRVTFLGAVPQTELKNFYNAADVLVLASRSEGWPNVLLEAMACGTPVAATNVSGTSEMVTQPAAGVVIHERSADGIVNAIERLRSHYPDRHATRQHASRYGWDETSKGQMNLFRQIVKR